MAKLFFCRKNSGATTHVNLKVLDQSLLSHPSLLLPNDLWCKELLHFNCEGRWTFSASVGNTVKNNYRIKLLIMFRELILHISHYGRRFFNGRRLLFTWKTSGPNSNFLSINCPRYQSTGCWLKSVILSVNSKKARHRWLDHICDSKNPLHLGDAMRSLADVFRSINRSRPVLNASLCRKSGKF